LAWLGDGDGASSESREGMGQGAPAAGTGRTGLAPAAGLSGFRVPLLWSKKRGGGDLTSICLYT
jgi:hypothetical protein